jgi:hypothetical protein
MNIIVVGCGRVGAELSHHLFKRGRLSTGCIPIFVGALWRAKVWRKVCSNAQASAKRMALQQ